jgi:hypothetical protein
MIFYRNGITEMSMSHSTSPRMLISPLQQINIAWQKYGLCKTADQNR